MKIHHILPLLVAVALLAGCADDAFQEDKEAFYKLYGNGTSQEAVAMHLGENGTSFIVGNQFVRNQDSAAVILMKTSSAGSQLWSRKYYGQGHATARTLLSLPSGDLLLLASSRQHESGLSSPLLLRVTQQGDLVKEYSIQQQTGTGAVSRVAEDMVLGEEGLVYILGNIYEGGVPVRSFIQKMSLETGALADQREFFNSEVTEAKKILRRGEEYLVLGNTRHFIDGVNNQSLFLATYSRNLVEAGNVVLGTPAKDVFERAFISSRNELVILSSEQDVTSKISKAVVWFTNPRSLTVHRQTYLSYSASEIPQAMEEDHEGNFYIAVNAVGDRGNINILLNKTDFAAAPLWSAPKAFGSAGEDKIREVQIAGDYLYLLSTLDMQNENTLISLTKVKF